MTSSITTTTLTCGMTLIVEPIPGVASAAMTWLLPVGSATDPVPGAKGDGQAALLSEFIFRGAGGMSSREHSDALDRAGIGRTSSVLTHHLDLGATMVGSRLAEALPLLTAMVRSPALAEESLDAVRSLCLQSLASLNDDPQTLAMLRLRERHQPEPLNRHGYGRPEVLQNTSIKALRAAWKERCVPRGSILAVAGAVQPQALIEQLNTLLEGWSGSHPEPLAVAPPARGRVHFKQDTAQVHLGLACDAPRESDANSMLERVAVNVLSGGTSSRLFTEVRQKRSLCYSVGASYRAGRDNGNVSLYAGTTPQRAAQTLEVCMAEIHRLRQGAAQDEYQRAVVGLKSHLVMQGESTAARAAALAHDYHRRGHARSLGEIASAVDAITLPKLNGYLSQRDFGEFTIVSIGPGDTLSAA